MNSQANRGPEHNLQDNLEARYAKFLQVGHNAYECVFMFGQAYKDSDRIAFHTRIVTGPQYAKAFLHTVRAAIERYEEDFGPIQTN